MGSSVLEYQRVAPARWYSRTLYGLHMPRSPPFMLLLTYPMVFRRSCFYYQNLCFLSPRLRLAETVGVIRIESHTLPPSFRNSSQMAGISRVCTGVSNTPDTLLYKD